MILLILRGNVLLIYVLQTFLERALLGVSSISGEKSIEPKVLRPGFESQLYSLWAECRLAFQSLNSFCRMGMHSAHGVAAKWLWKSWKAIQLTTWWHSRSIWTIFSWHYSRELHCVAWCICGKKGRRKKGGRAVYQGDPGNSQFSFSSLRTKVPDKVINSLWWGKNWVKPGVIHYRHQHNNAINKHHHQPYHHNCCHQPHHHNRH